VHASASIWRFRVYRSRLGDLRVLPLALEQPLRVYTIRGEEGGISVLEQFNEQVLGMLPKLRVQALALTRDRAAAADLVQDAVVSALGARDSFEPGTNFAAWMHAILRNRFISLTRRRREMVDIDDAPASFLAAPDGQESHLLLKELDRAMIRLQPPT